MMNDECEGIRSLYCHELCLKGLNKTMKSLRILDVPAAI
jgi:hypothetical protein